MMKVLSAVGVFFFLVVPVLAEAQASGTGNIFGRVVDPEGSPLPGVTVTLDGAFIAPVSIVTGDDGNFRFPNIPPARDYSITAELAGFRKVVRTDINVVLGSNFQVNIQMEFGVLEEEVTVTAERSQVVDIKRTQISQQVSQEMLQDLPQARSIFGIMHMAPGIITGSEDVGGSHAGAQHNPAARGGTGAYDTVLSVDGVAVQDGHARGSAAIFPDYDIFGEMVVTTGGSDVTVQTGGVSLEMITRRGGDRISFGGKFYSTDQYFQAQNLTDALRREGIPGTIGIREITDYGFNLGLPLVRDKAWLWVTYGVLDIKKVTIFGQPEEPKQTTYGMKLNLQPVPKNRFELLILGTLREVFGRSPSLANPSGYYQRSGYHFGTPTIKIQDDHTFGDNLLVSAKMTYVLQSWGYVPTIDREFENVAFFNITSQRWEGSTNKYFVDRPQSRTNLGIQYYNDTLFGVSHEIKLGGEYAWRGVESLGSPYPGNLVIRRNYNTPTVDFTGDGTPDIYPGIQRIEVGRVPASGKSKVDAFSFYFSDTISVKRLNFVLGIRYDRQLPTVLAYDYPGVIKDHPVWQKNFTPEVTNAVEKVLPAVPTPEIKATAADGSRYSWEVLSPRLGLTWDVTGDRRTLFKISAAEYGEFMGVAEANYWQRGGTGGWLHFWWLDHNGNGIVDLNELYWHNVTQAPRFQIYRVYDDTGNFLGNYQDAGGVMFGAYDPLNPFLTIDPYTVVDKSAGSERTRELIFAIERELAQDFGLSVNATFRRYDNRNWNLMYFPQTGQIQSQDWYMKAGTPPGTIPGLGDTEEAKNHEWYVLKPEYGYTPWTYRTQRPDYHINFYGLDFLFDKRLSNKWMLNASFSLLHQAVYYGDKGSLDRNNLWALDGRPEQTLNPRWMFKAGGLYQLPYDFDVSFTLLSREGRFISETFIIRDTRLPNPRSNSATLYMKERGSERLSAVHNLALRLQKRIRVGDAGVVYVMADVYNVLNSNTILVRQDRAHGTYFVHSGLFTPNVNYFRATEILSPRVARFGVRFQF